MPPIVPTPILEARKVALAAWEVYSQAVDAALAAGGQVWSAAETRANLHSLLAAAEAADTKADLVYDQYYFYLGLAQHQPGATDATASKAVSLLFSGAVRHTAVDGHIFLVRSQANPAVDYVVNLAESTCTCRYWHVANTAGTYCKHQVAAILSLAQAFPRLEVSR